jgi:hypothetical protein
MRRLLFHARELQAFQDDPNMLLEVLQHLHGTEFNLDDPSKRHLIDGKGTQPVAENTVRLMERHVSNYELQRQAMQCLSRIAFYNYDSDSDSDSDSEEPFPFPETHAVLSAEGTIDIILKVWCVHPELAEIAVCLLRNLTNALQAKNITGLSMTHRNKICELVVRGATVLGFPENLDIIQELCVVPTEADVGWVSTFVNTLLPAMTVVRPEPDPDSLVSTGIDLLTTLAEYDVGRKTVCKTLVNIDGAFTILREAATKSEVLVEYDTLFTSLLGCFKKCLKRKHDDTSSSSSSSSSSA